ncbi:helix-turn-helix transcriptional regulator [Bradyrhizobium sp. NAS96.2]|uniref:helix-turn-helix transcriptional regulator n=1 Tax=Bradyrhizobium sp. NAS96.2 TaxID=1680160 RepID=UPI0011612836|nr:helix-turn-helix transcriptional regulator [Bradyrhizobium sp. NAS96.2]
MLDLVAAIYDAALDAAHWPDVLNRIGDAVGGPEVIFGVYDPATGLSNLLAPRIDPVLVNRLLDWAPRNPLLPLGIGQAPGKVFTVGNFITQDQFTSTDFYQEWWHPAGYDVEPLTTNLLVDDSATGIFTSHGSLKRQPFGADQKRLFATLAQHLVRAVALQRRVYHLTFASESALAGFDRLQHGFLLVDAEARPLFTNRIAQDLLDADDGLRLEGGILSASDADCGRLLRKLVSSCPALAGIGAGGELTLRRKTGGSPLGVLVTPVPPETALVALPWTVSRRPVAIVLITDPETEMQARLDGLQQRFGLTPAEAAFALEIIKGDGRQAAADRLGITVGTARTHLSSIFDKTGSKRQAELVRLLLQK